MGQQGVLGQGGPTGPVVPNLPEGSPEMNAVRAGRFVPQPTPAPTPVQTQNAQGAGALTELAMSNTGGWTVPNANPTTANWKAPDLAAYDQQYATSLAASRAGIANQLQRALEDIGAQENIAMGVVGTLPGRYNDIYGQSEAAAQQGLSGLYNALQAQGLGNRYGQGMGALEQLTQPMQAAMGMGKSAFQASVPLAELGTRELFTRQKGALAQARLGADEQVTAAERDWIGKRAGIEADITARENEFRQQEAAREAERQRFNIEQKAQEERFRREQTQRERESVRSDRTQRAGQGADKSMSEYQKASLQLERDKMTADTAAKEKERQAALPKYGSEHVGFGKGELLARENPAEYEGIKKTAAYSSLKSDFDKKFKGGIKRQKDGTVKPEDIKKARDFLLEKAAGKPWDRSVSILMYEMGVDDSQMGLASLYKEKKKEDKLGWWR